MRAHFAAPEINLAQHGMEGSFWGLKGSASIKQRTLTLTVVNPHLAQARETQILLRGASARLVTANILSARDMHAHNTFDEPNAVAPSGATVPSSGGVLHCSFPAASVTQLQVNLV